MSWSVSGIGPAKAVASQIASQIVAVNLSDPGEMETVKFVGVTLSQALSTFDPDKVVSVQASGSMGYKDWTTKAGPYQQFKIEVNPIHFTT